jgi:hypothetical protein
MKLSAEIILIKHKKGLLKFNNPFYKIKYYWSSNKTYFTSIE